MSHVEIHEDPGGWRLVIVRSDRTEEAFVGEGRYIGQMLGAHGVRSMLGFTEEIDEHGNTYRRAEIAKDLNP